MAACLPKEITSFLSLLSIIWNMLMFCFVEYIDSINIF